jgi:hypothetical protein
MIRLLGTQAACGTLTGTASTFGNSNAVRLFNSGTAVHLVTLEQADGTDIGTISLNAKAEIILRKSPTDKIFAANAAVLGVAVGFHY